MIPYDQTFQRGQQCARDQLETLICCDQDKKGNGCTENDVFLPGNKTKIVSISKNITEVLFIENEDAPGKLDLMMPPKQLPCPNCKTKANSNSPHLQSLGDYIQHPLAFDFCRRKEDCDKP